MKLYVLFLKILDTILTDAYAMNEADFSSFAKSRGSMDDIKKLLQLTGIIHSRIYFYKNIKLTMYQAVTYNL